jgi:hypothetical protein
MADRKRAAATLEAGSGEDGCEHRSGEQLHHRASRPPSPTAWRRQPYYDQLRLWAKRNLHLGMYVIVGVNLEATLVLPDQDVPLGKMKYQDRISVRKVGNTYEATVIPAPAG